MAWTWTDLDNSTTKDSDLNRLPPRSSFLLARHALCGLHTAFGGSSARQEVEKWTSCYPGGRDMTLLVLAIAREIYDAHDCHGDSAFRPPFSVETRQRASGATVTKVDDATTGTSVWSFLHLLDWKPYLIKPESEPTMEIGRSRTETTVPPAKCESFKKSVRDHKYGRRYCRRQARLTSTFEEPTSSSLLLISMTASGTAEDGPSLKATSQSRPIAFRGSPRRRGSSYISFPDIVELSNEMEVEAPVSVLLLVEMLLVPVLSNDIGLIVPLGTIHQATWKEGTPFAC
ncbi:hypothetical protein B0H34DRAFT_679086 [Crassisporium funariophilum]|nr:hypothetical protein B0H34DRAFT_679086 [Crassisporium funariophilum]